MYNLKAGKSSGFEPLPEGRYSLKVDNVNVTPHTKNNEDGHRFEITFLVMDGPNKGRKVWDNVYLPGATWKMYSILEAGGSSLVSSENVTPESIAIGLQGLEVSAYLTTATGNNGKPRTDVSNYASLAGNGDVDISRLV